MELEDRLTRVEYKVAVLEEQEWTVQTCGVCKHLFRNVGEEYGICSKTPGSEPNTHPRGSACSHWLQAELPKAETQEVATCPEEQS